MAHRPQPIRLCFKGELTYATSSNAEAVQRARLDIEAAMTHAACLACPGMVSPLNGLVCVPATPPTISHTIPLGDPATRESHPRGFIVNMFLSPGQAGPLRDYLALNKGLFPLSFDASGRVVWTATVSGLPPLDCGSTMHYVEIKAPSHWAADEAAEVINAALRQSVGPGGEPMVVSHVAPVPSKSPLIRLRGSPMIMLDGAFTANMSLPANYRMPLGGFELRVQLVGEDPVGGGSEAPPKPELVIFINPTKATRLHVPAPAAAGHRPGPPGNVWNQPFPPAGAAPPVEATPPAGAAPQASATSPANAVPQADGGALDGAALHAGTYPPAGAAPLARAAALAGAALKAGAAPPDGAAPLADAAALTDAALQEGSAALSNAAPLAGSVLPGDAALQAGAASLASAALQDSVAPPDGATLMAGTAPPAGTALQASVAPPDGAALLAGTALQAGAADLASTEEETRATCSAGAIPLVDACAAGREGSSMLVDDPEAAAASAVADAADALGAEAIVDAADTANAQAMAALAASSPPKAGTSAGDGSFRDVVELWILFASR